MNARWNVIVCDALEKVYPDGTPRAWNPAITLSVALGEVASFQVAFRPDPPETDLDLRPVHIRVEGSTAQHTRVYRVDLVPCDLPVLRDPDENYDRVAPGLFPDLLTPLLATENNIMPLARGWRSLWFDVCVTDPAQSGTHTVTIVLLDGGGDEIFRRDISITIMPFALPPLDIVNTHWLHADCIADHYQVEVFSEEHWTLLERFLDALAHMGGNSVLTPVWTPPLDTARGHYRTPVQLVDIHENEDGKFDFGFDRLRRWLDLCARLGIRHIEIPPLFTQWGAHATPALYAHRDHESIRLFGWDVEATDPRYRRFLEQFLPPLCAVLDESRDRDCVVFHISDEPHGDDQLESYCHARAIVDDLLEGRRIVDALSDHRYLTTGAVQIPVVATDALDDFLIDPPDEIWAYYCVSQSTLVANRFFAMPSYRNRVIGQQLFAAQLNGFLHWGFNFYYSQHSRTRVDPFRDTCAGGAYPGGDAFIVYPGPDGFPLTSIRHHVFRQAMFDHRALQALRDRDGFDAAVAMVNADKKLSFTQYPTDPEYYLRIREMINMRLVNAMRPHT